MPPAKGKDTQNRWGITTDHNIWLIVWTKRAKVDVSQRKSLSKRWKLNPLLKSLHLMRIQDS